MSAKTRDDCATSAIDYEQQFNQTMSSLTDLASYFSSNNEFHLEKEDSNSQQFDSFMICMKKCLNNLILMINNDYFKFMYKNNVYVKKLVLDVIANVLLIKREDSQIEYVKWYQIMLIRNFVQIDVRIESNIERSNNLDSVFEIYEQFFGKIMPCLGQMVDVKNGELKFLADLIQSFCYMMMFVSMSVLASQEADIVPAKFKILTDRCHDLHLVSQMIFCLSLSLTNYLRKNEYFTLKLDSTTAANFLQFSKQITDLIFSQSESLTESSKSILKRSLELLFELIRENLKNEQSNRNDWYDLLNRILTSGLEILDKILASKAEVSVELVVHVYEFLLANFNEFDDEIKSKLANEKLKFIVKTFIKIKTSFELHETDYFRLQAVSFKLIAQFISQTRDEFDSLLWDLVQVCLVNNQPFNKAHHNHVLFDLIIEICRHNSHGQFYHYLVEMSSMLIRTFSFADHMIFLNTNAPNCLIELTKSFDFYLSIANGDHKIYSDFISHVYPLIDYCKDELAINLTTKSQFNAFLLFYSNLFAIKFKSNLLKSFKIWKSHIDEIFLKLDFYSDERYSFSIDSKCIDQLINLSEYLVEIDMYSYYIRLNEIKSSI